MGKNLVTQGNTQTGSQVIKNSFCLRVYRGTTKNGSNQSVSNLQSSSKIKRNHTQITSNIICFGELGNSRTPSQSTQIRKRQICLTLGNSIDKFVTQKITILAQFYIPDGLFCSWRFIFKFYFISKQFLQNYRKIRSQEQKRRSSG